MKKSSKQPSNLELIQTTRRPITGKEKTFRDKKKARKADRTGRKAKYKDKL